VAGMATMKCLDSDFLIDILTGKSRMQNVGNCRKKIKGLLSNQIKKWMGQSEKGSVNSTK